ncbi:MAG: HNH endonuclease [Gammaproteobacteria bacterium]|nr:MAG: HNH endonuclease [Gammaproteobacteria bacterium]
MRFWWVNQNQTFQQETEGGYLWSPKRNSNGRINAFYEFMREVAPGDAVFSFQGTYIRAIGIARSSAYESPKPPEFGRAGPNWSNIGWRVDVHFIFLNNQIRPADFMHQLGPALPERYSPLQAIGRGNQGVYLTRVSPQLAAVLVSLIGREARDLVAQIGMMAEKEGEHQRDTAVGLVQWEEHLLQKVHDDETIPVTEKEAVILARRGQGKFKEAVLKIEPRCRITKVDRIEHLRASHIRPWRDCEDHRQRLDGENGFLLTPSIDHLFDRGFISFENNGELLVSPAAHRQSLNRMGVETERRLNVGAFNEGQKHYLDYHRGTVFLQAQVYV